MSNKLYLVGMNVQDYNGNVVFETKYCGYQESKAKAAYRAWLCHNNIIFKIIENVNELGDYYQENNQEGALTLLESKIRNKINRTLGANYSYKNQTTLQQLLNGVREMSFMPRIRKFGNDPNKLKLRMVYNNDSYSSSRSILPLDEIMDCLVFHIKRTKKESGLTHVPVLIRLVDSATKITKDMEV